MPVPAALARFILLRLASDNPEENKRGLQEACELLEAGRVFLDNQTLITFMTRFIGSPNIRVRRWAYKLAALVQDDRALPALLAAFDNEVDLENQSWIAAALFSVMHDLQIEKWLRQSGEHFFGTFLELAARLFARTTFLEDRSAVGRKEFDADPMVRKWTSLLCGYQVEIPADILKNVQDLDLVGGLVTDDSDQSVEYAIWAQHRHPSGSDKKLLKNPREIIETRPSNVRRWTLRIITKGLSAARQHKDLIVSEMRDKSPEAREGLALGLGRLKPFGLNPEIRSWFRAELDDSVSIALVDHMAHCARADPNAMNDLLTKYAETKDNAMICRRIEAALSEDTDARRRLSDIQTRHEPHDSSLPLHQLNGAPPVTLMVMNMTKNTHIEKQSVITNSTLTNVAVNADEITRSIIGNIDNSAEPSIQHMSEAIKAFTLALTTDQKVDAEFRTEILKQLADFVSASAAPERKSFGKRLLLSLGGLLQVAGNASQVATAIDQLAPKIQSAIG